MSGTTPAPLTPLETLTRTPRLNDGVAPLPDALQALYGVFDMPAAHHRPAVIGNFVSSLDGVVALNTPGVITGGGEISGFNQHDRMVMGILRAIADVVVVGAGTLRAAPKHLWLAEFIYPPMAAEYRALRAQLGLHPAPLTVIVSGSGDLDLSMLVFNTPEAEALIVTTETGMARLSQRPLPPPTRALAVTDGARVTAAAALAAAISLRPSDVILTEGGPSLMSDFLAESKLDELFLTLAPQVAGRSSANPRPGFADGYLFAPGDPRWGALLDVRRGGSHLFLRYGFDERGSAGG